MIRRFLFLNILLWIYLVIAVFMKPTLAEAEAFIPSMLMGVGTMLLILSLLVYEK